MTDSSAAELVAESSLHDALDAICASGVFRHSPQQQRFLRHLLAKMHKGDLGALREMTLGIELFQRPPEAFDPKKDPIVRVEARRLRERLFRYYAAEGAAATIEVVLPIGRYVPLVRARRLLPAVGPALPATASALEERGWYLMRMRTIEGYRGALDLFTRATEEFVDFAAAYRGVAWARICINGHDGLPPEAIVQRAPIAAAIEKAASIEPAHPHLLILKGAYATRFEQNLALAYSLHNAGIAAAAGMSSMRTSLGWLHLLSGRFMEAEQVFNAAFALDPYGFWHRHNLASLAYVRRQYDAAEELLGEALEIEPTHAVMRLLLARVLMLNGRAAQALEQTQWCMRALPGMAGPQLWRIAALASAGETGSARAALRAFDSSFAGRYVSPVCRAIACNAVGELDRALEWLTMAAEQRDYWLPNVATEPAFDALRGRPEFARTLVSAGLPLVV
ncbi:MAG: tetratricopeptide repeat protein [Betaproteobacteria bacterium]